MIDFGKTNVSVLGKIEVNLDQYESCWGGYSDQRSKMCIEP